MTSILTRTTRKVRHTVKDLNKINSGIDTEMVSAQVKSLLGVDDLDLVRNAMIDRYAQVIVPEKDETIGATDTHIYRANSRLKLDFAAQSAILAGQQEIVRFYLFNSIVRQRATLFNAPNQRYEYEGQNTEEIIADVRSDGNANLCAQRWDAYADGIGSCALYISDAGGRMAYTEIAPHQIWVAYAETILDGDIERPVNVDDLDEASLVVVEIAPCSDKRRFAAWYGPCDMYERGRHCVYEGNDWKDIPEVGALGALDYSISAKAFVRSATDVGNPLSLIADSQGDTNAPCYPIAILYGDAMQRGLIPVTHSLYQVCGELDLMGSMVLGAAGRGARGAKAFKRGSDTNVPDSVDEGMVLLGREQELSNVGWPASHAKDAMAVINDFARHIAETWCVPGWLVVADQAGEVPSGVALEIMTLPLRQCRESRIELNRHSVARRFAIERLIINGAVGTTTIPADEVETWYPGERPRPVDPFVQVQTWQQRIQMGLSDLADAAMELHGLKTHEEAVAWLEERKTLQNSTPVLQTQKAAKPTLAHRLGGGASPLKNGTENQVQRQIKPGERGE